MFNLLLESRPVGRARPWSGGLVAIAAHAAVIFSIVRAAAHAAPQSVPVIIDTLPPYHDPGTERPEPQRGPLLPVFNPTGLIVPLESLPRIESALDLGPHLTGQSNDPAGSGTVDLGSGPGDDVIVPWLADERPELLAAPPPRYPDFLRTAGIEGRVVVRAIVDTLGRAEPGSIQVVSASHPEFQAPAVDCIRQARFRPARVRGRAVRVLVEIPVDFRIRR